MKKITRLAVVFLTLFQTLLPKSVLAATADNCKDSIGGFLNFPTWYKYLNPSFDGTSCNLTFDITQDLPKVALAIFEILLRVGGMVAVGFIIYGGFQYILSQGNGDQTKAARSSIINALIGLAISISSVTVVNLVGKNL